jgi:hypothetical protein
MKNDSNPKKDNAEPKKKETKSLAPLYKFRDLCSAYGITGYKLREFSARVNFPQYKLITEGEFKNLYKKRYGVTL